MTTASPSDLHQRLNALELSVAKLDRQSRRYRQMLQLMLLCVTVALLFAPTSASQTPRTVEAQGFVLVDASGGTRGGLHLTPDGSSLLTLADSKQRVRLFASVAVGGATELVLSDAQDKRRLIAGVDAKNIPYISLRNAASTSASASLAVTGSGNPVFRLADAAGRPRLVTGFAGDESTLSLHGGGSRHGVVLATDNQTSRLSLADSTGTDRLWVAIRNESPVLQFLNKAGSPRSGFTTVNDDTGVAVISQSPGAAQPGLVLYGKDMKVLWAGPDK